MKIITGDLIELAKQDEFNIIIHGCNCFCTMGNGIAKQIKAEFPLAYKVDCETKEGDELKLGTYSVATMDNLIVVNAYTQFGYNMKEKPVDYYAIKQAFRLIAKNVKEGFPEAKIGYPKIGAGLAGGDWDIISKIIDEELEGLDHTLVVLPE